MFHSTFCFYSKAVTILTVLDTKGGMPIHPQRKFSHIVGDDHQDSCRPLVGIIGGGREPQKTRAGI